MDVSVVIPTYNRAVLLRRALASVLGQTRAPREVIVVDDGFSDDTEEQVRDGFPQVRYVRQQHQGVSSARNHGIRLAVSEWLAFLDSDDEWLPAKLATQMDALSTHPEYRICHTNEIWIRRGRRVNPMNKHAKQGGWIFRHCLPLCVISPSAVLIHASVFDRLGVFDETLPVCEDYDLWLRYCAVLPVLYLQQPLTVKYGGHSDQLSGLHWGMDRFRIRALEKVIRSPALSEDDQTAALHTLLEKMEIVRSGAEKRDKREQAGYYASKQALYRRQLLALIDGRAA